MAGGAPDFGVMNRTRQRRPREKQQARDRDHGRRKQRWRGGRRKAGSILSRHQGGPSGRLCSPGGSYTRGRLRVPRGIRATAWALVAAGIAAPVVRRRLKLPPPVVIGAGAAAPVALCVAVRRSKARDAAVCALNMWAYVAAYEMPHDDPERLERRVRVDYPARPTGSSASGFRRRSVSSERSPRPGTINRFERVLVLCHWMWFLVPHTSLAYVLLRRPERFPRPPRRGCTPCSIWVRCSTGRSPPPRRGGPPRTAVSTTPAPPRCGG